ncbi:MAG: FlgD immunoglobulin-like domain containing protein, partial [candidate division WOR-3 bacterium]
QVWCYTPGSGWAQATDMNQGRVFAHGCVYHDTIWVTGGNANEVALTHSEFYDPVSETWTVDNSLFPNLPVATWAGASGIVGQTMFVFSGVGASLQLMDTTQYFDFATRTWTVTPSVYLMVYRGCGTGNADGKAVVYGGSTGGFTPTNICQYEQLGTGAVESKSDNWKEIDGIAPTFIHDFCRISYNVPVAGKVTLNIYDASGSLVKTLVNGMSEPGEKNVAWDRRDAKGNRVVSGTYFFRLSVPNRSVSAKAILLQ